MSSLKSSAIVNIIVVLANKTLLNPFLRLHFGFSARGFDFGTRLSITRLQWLQGKPEIYQHGDSIHIRYLAFLSHRNIIKWDFNTLNAHVYIFKIYNFVKKNSAVTF